MKRYFSLLICALLCIGITGCSKESGNTETHVSDKSSLTESTDEISENSKIISEEPSDKKETENNMIEVVDKNGNPIGHIPFNSGMTLTNNGIFYTTTILNELNPDTITVGQDEGEGNVIKILLLITRYAIMCKKNKNGVDINGYNKSNLPLL